MKASTVLRRAEPADRLQLMPLVEAYCQHDRHAFDPERVARALDPLLEDDRHGIVWLIGEPVSGYAVVTWGYSLESGGRDALLDEIYIAERNRGLGTVALEEILSDLAQRGIGRVFLETEAHNERVRRFYQRLGFVAEDSVWMTRDISPSP